MNDKKQKKNKTLQKMAYKYMKRVTSLQNKDMKLKLKVGSLFSYSLTGKQNAGILYGWTGGASATVLKIFGVGDMF